MTKTSHVIPINDKIAFKKEILSQGEKGHLFSVMDVSFLLEELLGRNVEVVTPEGLSPYIGPHILKEVERVDIAA